MKKLLVSTSLSLALLLGSVHMSEANAAKLKMSDVTKMCNQIDTAEASVDALVTLFGALPRLIKNNSKIKSIIGKVSSLDSSMDSIRDICELGELLKAD